MTVQPFLVETVKGPQGPVRRSYYRGAKAPHAKRNPISPKVFIYPSTNPTTQKNPKINFVEKLKTPNLFPLLWCQLDVPRPYCVVSNQGEAPNLTAVAREFAPSRPTLRWHTPHGSKTRQIEEKSSVFKVPPKLTQKRISPSSTSLANP